MILAAGRGERMRPLSDTVPKPLLTVYGKPLIVYHIEKLAQSGFKTIVINIAHLGHKIPEALGDGSQWGVTLLYSDEHDEGALESAGGIVKALPLLGEAFLVVNGDVWCDYTFDAHTALKQYLAHLIVVPNPEHHQEGDFALKDGILATEGTPKFTFSGIGYYRAELFKDLPYGKTALAPLLKTAMTNRRVSGMLYEGVWRDIGTPERLTALNACR